MVVYCFHSVEGYSKVGSFVGNNSTTDNVFVYCGFKPAMVLTKAIDDSGQDWTLRDNKRNAYNVVDTALEPNSNVADSTATNFNIDFLSNGFRPYNNNTQGAGYAEQLYIAFAESPFKYSNAR